MVGEHYFGNLFRVFFYKIDIDKVLPVASAEFTTGQQAFDVG